ncbi:unnamed protein product [Miscanthus lutarioriparius]|uniref:TF-B3 domain-containing protein n=1 Tax=Miscanthus lutarioriparius TaxID=422564 RepID=A0A811MZM5_9POAL|nr:unnamed protein product [Miscanthus lutarioriparius]
MRKPGKRSRDRHAYFCSNHKDEEDKYFFKVLVGDFGEGLAIPGKFVQRFRGLIANSVKLESRCGHTFNVEVANNLGKLVLLTGWKAFVTAHDLKMGDFLDMPRVYAEVYLPFEDQTLMLQCCGKSWEVRCLIQKGNPGSKRFLQGWKQFACDNKLQLGDLFLFELLENTKYTMKVHVIRAK